MKRMLTLMGLVASLWAAGCNGIETRVQPYANNAPEIRYPETKQETKSQVYSSSSEIVVDWGRMAYTKGGKISTCGAAGCSPILLTYRDEAILAHAYGDKKREHADFWPVYTSNAAKKFLREIGKRKIPKKQCRVRTIAGKEYDLMVILGDFKRAGIAAEGYVDFEPRDVVYDTRTGILTIHHIYNDEPNVVSFEEGLKAWQEQQKLIHGMHLLRKPKEVRLYIAIGSNPAPLDAYFQHYYRYP